VAGAQESIYRSGLADGNIRFSVNLTGGPAMSINEFRYWRQKTVVGASLTAVVPGSNRWAVKPEIGLSQRWSLWILDAYGAVWFFTVKNHYYTGRLAQTELPMGAVEIHLSYDVKPRLWFSADANFWYGGATSLNGLENANTRQKNSRVGATASIPLNKRQSFKFSYSAGAYIRFGGD